MYRRGRVKRKSRRKFAENRVKTHLAGCECRINEEETNEGRPKKQHVSQEVKPDRASDTMLRRFSRKRLRRGQYKLNGSDETIQNPHFAALRAGLGDRSFTRRFSYALSIMFVTSLMMRPMSKSEPG